MGIELTDADFNQPGELSDDELGAVAGGKLCFCTVGGGEKGGDDDACACVAYGVGEEAGSSKQRCVCAIGGQGKSMN